MAARHDYVDLGEQAISELVDREHAVVSPEIEARIAEQPWGELPVPIDPHHLSTARRNLVKAYAIRPIHGRTRGGREVTVYVPADATNRSRAIEDASARKRLLHGRYLVWATGNKRQPALIGPAGEAVVHASFTGAAPHGFRLLNPSTGEVRQILGEDVDGGPLDNGAWLTTIAEDGSPSTFLVPVEVKNIRSWIYPTSAELHQLLAKAAALQLARPHLRVAPVFVCRRAQWTTFQMAKQLGLFVIETRRQPIRPSADLDRAHLDEVRQELGYADMTTDLRALPWMIDRLSGPFQREAEGIAARWAQSAPEMLPRYRALRLPIPEPERSRFMESFRSHVTSTLGETVSW